MQKLKIDGNIRNLIPPLSTEELAGLETSIVREGCRDPLVAWADTGVLLDGHNRLDICTKHKLPYEVSYLQFETRDEALIWVIDNQFARRNLTTAARVELELKKEGILQVAAKERQRQSQGRGKKGSRNQETLTPIHTDVDIAKAAGVSKDTVHKVRTILREADAETKNKLRTSNEISINRAYRDLQERKAKQKRNTARKKAAQTTRITEQIIVGDFCKHADKVANGSVSLIFSDPPYNRKATASLGEFGAFAAAKLCEGGSLVCYVGHVQLPAAIEALGGHLRYWWTACCLHSGPKGLMREYGIRPGWKPMLWFVKGTRDNKENILTDVVSGGREKDTHEWQQAEAEAAYWIEHLCPADGLVCDPYLGGGTTAIAAERLSRKWIGFEIDAHTAAMASQRVTV